MKSVGIIGLGRFGRLLQEFLQPEITAIAHDPHVKSHTLDEVLEQENIFICTPIRDFSTIVEAIAPKLKPNTTILDVCSVKVYPVKIMQQHLPEHVDIIATHPLFGPDSVRHSHVNNIMLAKIRDQYHRFDFWRAFFVAKNLNLVEISPDEHDRYMARSQGITHLLGRTLAAIEAEATPLNTAGYSQLLKIMKHTCNDSLELFYDLERFNPYSKAENHKLLKAIEKLIREIEEKSP